MSNEMGNQLKIFTSYYATLCKILPVQELIPNFVACGVINFDDEEEILSQLKPSEKARLFLSHVRKPLEVGMPNSFYKLVEIMQLSAHDDCRELAKKIRAELQVGHDATAQEM